MDGFFGTMLGKIVLSAIGLAPIIIALVARYDALSNMRWDEHAPIKRTISGAFAGVLVIVWIAYMAWIWK